ncbi:MAG: flagellar hook-associated protein FlgL [Oscillospiraceae bacterium]
MRVTQSMMTRNYMKNLNSAVGNVAKSNQRITSGRKYTKLSENVAEGSKALKVREELYKNEQYVENIKTAENELSSAESNLKSMTEILQTAQERMTKGLNGTISPSDREIIAKEIRGLQDQVLKTVNAKYGDKYLFSGTNNGGAPFKLSSDGSVLYNGFAVNDIFQKDGKYYVPGATPTDPPTLVPQNEKMFIDIGLGIKMSGDNVDPTTAFETSFSGLGIIGFGVSDSGLPNNVIGLLGTMADKLSPKPPASYDVKKAEQCLELLKGQTDLVVSNMTEIGTRCNFLEKTTERIESDVLNLQGLRTRLENTNDAEETMNMKMYEYAWMATLKMGSKIIPMSLMDFIN